MADVIYIALTLAFFGLSVAYVFMCDRIIGPDEPVTVHTDATQEREQERVRT